MWTIAVWTLLLVIRPALAESGDSAYEDDEQDIDEPISFECFTKGTINASELFCLLIPTSNMDSWNIHFKACLYIDDDEPTDCQHMKKMDNNYQLENVFSGLYNVCMIISGIPTCRKYETNKTVLGKPFPDLKVSYDETSKDHKIAFKSPYGNGDTLQNNHTATKSSYEILLRKVNEEWPGCDKDSIAKQMCIITTDEEVRIPDTMLEPDTKYEANVRATLKHNLIGTVNWWTRSAIFKTNKIQVDEKYVKKTISFECHTSLHVDLSEIFCRLINASDMDSRNIHFNACLYDHKDKPTGCQKMRKMDDSYRRKIFGSSSYNICMNISGISTCKKYETNQIVLGKTPLNLTVSYHEIGKEHEIAFISPYGDGDMLQNNVQYEILLRKVNEEWPECSSDMIAKTMCIITNYNEVLLPDTKLKPDTKYEVKVRSKPTGLFNGTASLWTSSTIFKTSKRKVDEKYVKEPISFECHTSLHVELSEIFCRLINASDMDSRNIHFNACLYAMDKLTGCRKMRKTDNSYRRKTFGPSSYDICMIISGISICKIYKTDQIVLGKTPLNLTVSYHEIGKEHEIAFISPYGDGDMLQNNVQYEILLRKVNEEWPECSSDMIAKKMCIITNHNEVLIPDTKLEPDTNYEAKIRSKPAGFFNGTASLWTSSAIFYTSKRNVSEEIAEIPNSIMLSTGLFLSLFLLLTIVVVTFWKSRIKPLLWPDIPDHKTTLEKLCKKPVKHQDIISFNPYIFEDKSINKVDHVQPKELIEDGFLHQGEAEEQLLSEFNKTSEREIERTIGETSALPNGNVNVVFSESQDIQCINPCKHTTVTDSHMSSSLDNTAMTDNGFLISCESGIENSEPPESIIIDVSSSMTDNSHIQQITPKQTSNGFNVMSWEEAYIEMSAFKTPISSTK